VSDPDDDAAFQLRLLDTAWYEARQHWTDGGATHFEKNHWRPLDERARAYAASLRTLTELLAAAERATDY
jgi:hypothetical protein